MYAHCIECSHPIWPGDAVRHVRHGWGWSPAHAECVPVDDEAADLIDRQDAHHDARQAVA